MSAKKADSHKRSYEFLPSKLISAIDLKIIENKNIRDYRRKNNLIKCIALIYHQQITLYGLDAYVPLGRSYWRKVFGGNYKPNVIKPLIDMGIIESYGPNDAYQQTQTGQVSIRYHVQPDLLAGDYEMIYYLPKLSPQAGSHTKATGKKSDDTHIGIMREKATDFIDHDLESICRSEFFDKQFADHLPENFHIEYHMHLVMEGRHTYDKHYGTVESARNQAFRMGKELFFFRDKFYVADPEVFLKHRIAAMKHHYHREISKVGVLPIDKHRSPLTLRMYNYLTNFPSKLLPFLTINNNTVHQIDLSTSQALLFANILNVYLNESFDIRLLGEEKEKGEKHLLKLFKRQQTRKYLKRLFQILKKHRKQLPSHGLNDNHVQPHHDFNDVIRYISNVFNDDFYFVLKQRLDLPDRATAKLFTFKLLFGKGEKRDPYTIKFQDAYPTIMRIINDFKTDEKKATKTKPQDLNFAVFLQCVECEIFIDRVYKPLRQQGVDCFARHDSIVVENGKENTVKNHIQKVFDEIGFVYKYTEEDKLLEVLSEDELRIELDFFDDAYA